MPSGVSDQVDYFQHDFNALDLHSTWKVATREKDKVTNGRRVSCLFTVSFLNHYSWKMQAGGGFFKNCFNYQRYQLLKLE